MLSLAYNAVSSYVSNWIIRDEVIVKERGSNEIATQSASAQEMTLTPTGIREDSSKFIIEVNYPTFNLSILDEQVKQLLEARVSEFKFANRNSDTKAGFGANYETPYVNTGIISFRVNTCIYFILEYGDSRCSHGAIGINFDKTNNRMYTLDDALKLIGMDLNELSRESAKQLAQSGDELTKVVYEEGIAPYPQNFSAFLINDQEVTFLFQQGQASAMVASVSEVKFSRIDK